MAEGLRLEAVDPGTFDLIKRLMADKRLDDFNLVGGTALALQLGHRRSVDIDLFTTREFDSGRLAEHLKQWYNADISRQSKTGIFGHIDKVKFDVVKDPLPLIDDVKKIDGIRMLSLRDIGAMKMAAIYDDGGRLKDFADMYKLLEKHPLKIYLDYAEQKDPEIHPAILKQSLLYHADIKFDESVTPIGKAVEWPTIADRLREAFHNPGKLFEIGDQLKDEHKIRKTPRQGYRHRP